MMDDNALDFVRAIWLLLKLILKEDNGLDYDVCESPGVQLLLYQLSWFFNLDLTLHGFIFAMHLSL